jgi:hypothetical protein
MPDLLLNLRNVPEDEADEVRALLDEHEIEFYETPPSLWGVSAGAIWTRRDEDAREAKRLLAEYQVRRQAEARREYEAAEREGLTKTVWTTFREEPLRMIAVLMGIAFLLALMTLPFLLLG